MANDEWMTPNYVFEWLQLEGFYFVYDLAATIKNTFCELYFTKEDDALKQDWWKGPQGDYFLNPPYSKPNLELFMKKAYEEGVAMKGTGKGSIVCLVPLDPVGWARKYVWGKAEVWIPDERINFLDSATNAPGNSGASKGSMIVIYGKQATPGLIKAVHIPKPEELRSIA